MDPKKYDYETTGKPQTSTKTTLWIAETKEGEKKQIAYVQSIGALKSAKEAITYGALDLDEEQQAKGRRKAETNEIVILYTEEQHKELKKYSDSDKSYYIYVKYPESTKSQEEDSLVMSFTGSIDLVGNEIAIDDMLQDTLTIYRDSEVTESYGFPASEAV